MIGRQLYKGAGYRMPGHPFPLSLVCSPIRFLSPLFSFSVWFARCSSVLICLSLLSFPPSGFSRGSSFPFVAGGSLPLVRSFLPFLLMFICWPPPITKLTAVATPEEEEGDRRSRSRRRRRRRRRRGRSSLASSLAAAWLVV